MKMRRVFGVMLLCLFVVFVSVSVSNAQTAATTIGGTFESTNVAGFVRVAHAVLGLRVQYRPGETVISQ